MIKLQKYNIPKETKFTYCVFLVIWDFLDHPKLIVKVGDRDYCGLDDDP